MQALQRDIACPDIKISQCLPDVVSDVDYLLPCCSIETDLIAKNTKERAVRSLNKGGGFSSIHFEPLGQLRLFSLDADGMTKAVVIHNIPATGTMCASLSTVSPSSV